MIREQVLNVAPLKTVEAELYATIQQASSAFEAFLADRSAIKSLEESIDHTDQLRGVLTLLQIEGACTLTEAMVALLKQMASNSKALSDYNLSALSHAFIALPCFIEYAIGNQKATPILIAPYINEVLAAARRPLLPEVSFTDFNYSGPALCPDGNKGEIQTDTLRRLRHMYQVGLLAAFKEGQHQNKMLLLARALERLVQQSHGEPISELWWLGSALVDAFSETLLDLTLYRKRLLASFDRYLKQREAGQAPHLPAQLRQELLFLIALSGCRSERCQAVIDAYGLPLLNYTDASIRRQRDAMQGPNATTIASMVSAIKEELAGAKEIMEIAAQDVTASTVDLQPLIDTLGRVADILKVVGLHNASNILRNQHDKIASWSAGHADMTPGIMLEMADALLYVESSLSGLQRLDIEEEILEQASQMTKKEVIASSHLLEAEKVVIHEAQAGISLAKRAINSFIESNYDSVHISNVATTLNSVKGGLTVLGLTRAAAVLNSSMTFVDSALKRGVKDGNVVNMLETLADALIAVEYYLDEVSAHHKADDNVLELAEESLAALGFPCH